MATTWLLQVCGKMLYLPKLILTIHGPTVIKRGTWVLSKSNITKDEAKALKDHRKDKDWGIFTVGKMVALVVLDRKDYINKAMDLLVDGDT